MAENPPQTGKKLVCTGLGESIALAEALREAGDDLKGAIALLYTPRHCRLAKLEYGVLFDRKGRSVGDDAFEARVFDEKRELRWLQHEMNGATRRGRAVLIEEHSTGDEAGTFKALDCSYIVWGEGDGVTEAGWSRVSSARIGPLWVPIVGIRERQIIELTAREYIARDVKTGNAYIAEERLTGLRPYAERSNG